ncbi:MAG: TIGR02996 domain-containing protein [Planctomycetales bacterium]
MAADPHAPFHAEIAAASEDDAPKLVYADWLEERGDPAAEAWRWIVATTLEKVHPCRSFGSVRNECIYMLDKEFRIRR